MPTVINIYSMKVNSISHNGSVNIGDSFHNAHTANSKSQGKNSSYGDVSPTSAGMENVFIDPDMVDQTDVATPNIVDAIQS